MGYTRPIFRFATILVGMAVCAMAFYFIPPPRGIGPRIAWICSIFALTLPIVAWGLRPILATLTAIDKSKHPFHINLLHVALFLGVAAGIVQIVLLAMRSVYVGIDLMHGYAWQGVRDFGFGHAGLWTLLALSVACGVGWHSTRNGGLLTVQFWITVIIAIWACLLADPFQATRTGGFERTDSTLLLVECLACLILIAVLVTGWLSEPDSRNAPTANDSPGDEMALQHAVPPGFRPSIAILALALNVTIMFHILVPAGQSTSILRLSGLRAGIAALIAAAGCLILLRRSWGAHLADATLGLFAIGLCGLATVAVPSRSIPLDHRYPMIFNAIIIGYAVAAGVFAHLAWWWARADEDSESTRKRVIPHLKRFAFFCAATGLLSGVMMCFWPGVPGVSTMDHSFGRVIAGFAGFLFLLLVTLRSSRLMERLSFHFLTVAVAACMVAFLAVRALPFTSDVAR